MMRMTALEHHVLCISRHDPVACGACHQAAEPPYDPVLNPGPNTPRSLADRAHEPEWDLLTEDQRALVNDTLRSYFAHASLLINARNLCAGRGSVERIRNSLEHIDYVMATTTTPAFPDEIGDFDV